MLLLEPKGGLQDSPLSYRGAHAGKGAMKKAKKLRKTKLGRRKSLN
jgi:hypothetical protein